MRFTLSFLLGLASFIGCRDSGEIAGPLWYDGGRTGDIVMADPQADPLSLYPTNPYSILAATLSGDVLTLNVSLSSAHPQGLTLVVFRYWLKSNPVQVDAIVSFERSGNTATTCQRWVRFNLVPLRDAYIRAYGSNGPITLNLWSQNTIVARINDVSQSLRW